jgi:DNA-directed RNA polymerase specialized sigma24 family protein
MGPELRSDEDLLAARDGASFELFYRRHAERMLGHLMRRTRDAELAADLTAETFAAALASRRRYSAHFAATHARTGSRRRSGSRAMATW